MGKSLKNRFNGNSEEVVSYAKTFGILRAMDYYHVKDYVAMSTFLEESAPQAKFIPAEVESEPFARTDAFDKLCEAIVRKLERQTTQIQTQANEIIKLKQELAYYKSGRWRDAMPGVKALLSEVKE